MIITTKQELRDFEFWAGAEERAILLTDDEFKIIEEELEKRYPDGLAEDVLNDMFWHAFDWIAGMIAETEDSILARE